MDSLELPERRADHNITGGCRLDRQVRPGDSVLDVRAGRVAIEVRAECHVQEKLLPNRTAVVPSEPPIECSLDEIERIPPNGNPISGLRDVRFNQCRGKPRESLLVGP